MTIDDRELDEFEDLIGNGDLAAIEQKLKEKPGILEHLSTFHGKTWLHLAAFEGKPELVRFFFDRGISLNTTDDADQTPLSAVICNGDFETANWMLENGADVSLSRWPMIEAVSGGHLEMVKTLIERGADYNFEFGEPLRTPLSQAVDFGHPQVSDYLRSLGAKVPDGWQPASEREPTVEELAAAFDEPLDVEDEVLAYFRHHMQKAPYPQPMQEVIPGNVRITVWTVKSADGELPNVIFTTGMSTRRMCVPPDCDGCEYAELVMYLPPDWPTAPNLHDSSQAWPWRWLRKIAHYPHETGDWIQRFPSTFANGDPPEPLDASCPFTAFLLVPNFALKSFISDTGKEINIITVMPIYTEECELAKSDDGIAELFNRFEAANIGSRLDMRRPNVAK